MSEEEDNHDESELDLEADFIQKMQDARIQDAEPESLVEQVKVCHSQLRAKYGLTNQYPALYPGILVEPTSNRNIPKVLFVLLGPSKDTHASTAGYSRDWNPFTKASNNLYTKSLTALHNAIQNRNAAFGLADFYLIDAFPRLYWNGSSTPSAKDYWDHYNYGVEYVKFVIGVVKPKFVLSFGSQSAFIVEAAFKVIYPMKSNFSTNNKYAHSFNKEVIMTHMSSTNVYYCKHPACRADDKFNLVYTAIDDICAFSNL